MRFVSWGVSRVMKNILALFVICGLLSTSPAALCESADHPLRLVRHKSNPAGISSLAGQHTRSANTSNTSNTAAPGERSSNPSLAVKNGQSVDSPMAAQHSQPDGSADDLYDAETVPFVDNFNPAVPKRISGNLRAHENSRGTQSALAADQFQTPKTPASDHQNDINSEPLKQTPADPTDSGAAEAAALSSSDPAIAQLEYQMWQEVNRDRAANGSRPIRLDAQLSKLARDYAEYMMHKKFFAHLDPQGRNPEDRAHAAGIASSVYENISWASRDGRSDLGRLEESEADMMDEPRNQQNHRSNILGTTHGAVGIGIARNGGKIFMVQEYTD